MSADSRSLGRRQFIAAAGATAAAGVVAGVLQHEVTPWAQAEEAAQVSQTYTDPTLGDDVPAEVQIADWNKVSKAFYQIKPENVAPFPAIKEPEAYDYEADALIVGYGVGGTSAVTGLVNHGLSVVAMERSDRDHWVEHAGVHWLYFFGAPTWMEAVGFGDREYNEEFIREYILKEATESTSDISLQDWDTLVKFYLANLDAYNMIVDADQSDAPATTFEQVPMFPALERWPTLIPRNENLGGWASPAVHDGVTMYPSGQKYHVVENYLDRRAQEKGAKVLWGVRATNLIMNDEGAVCGAKGVDQDGNVVYVKARAVIDGVGGFGANYDMVRYLIPDAPETIGCHIGTLNNDGAGIRLCQGAGASIRSCGRVDDMADAGMDVLDYGDEWTFVRDGATTCWYSGYFHIAHRLGRNPWLKVNKYGYRFMNEDNGWTEKGKYTYKQPGHKMFAIFDGKWHEHMHQLYDIDERWGGCERISDISGATYWDDDHIIGKDSKSTPDNEGDLERAVEEGYVIRADTLEELAEKAGINRANLIETVERYNALCEAGEDTDYGKEPSLLWPVSEPPFYALPRMSCYAWTCGDALATNVKGEVLNDVGEPIPGLYCGSNDASILDYATGEYYRDGLIIGGAVYAITMGYLSAESIAEAIEADGGSMGPVVQNAPTGKTVSFAATPEGEAGYAFVKENCGTCHSVPSKGNFADLDSEERMIDQFGHHDNMEYSADDATSMYAWVSE